MEDRSDKALEGPVRRLWSAYAWLRDTDLQGLSGTSRLLHDGDVGYLCSRLRDELLELGGVLSGEHRHRTREEDVILEGSQVCYWAYLIALCSGATYGDLSPHAHLAGGVERPAASEAATLLEETAALAECIVAFDRQNVLPLLKKALCAVGEACRSCGVGVRDVVEYDLRQIEGRPYMRTETSDRDPTSP